MDSDRGFDTTTRSFSVASVAVDTPLSHLDRPFDYSIPPELDESVVPGCRVKVRFSGRRVDGFVIERKEASDFSGSLAPIQKVVSSEPVLTKEVWALVQAVAARYAGTASDVLRLAIPPRHARAESAPRSSRGDGPVGDSRSTWSSFVFGEEFLAELARGGRPRAVVSLVPGHDPALIVAEAVRSAVQAQRGAIICVPDLRDVRRWDAVLTRVLGTGRHVVLTAADKPAVRYRAFLALARGDASVVLGTRAAAYAPVRDLGLVAMWDDGDDLFCEPRAPYPHAREVLLTRAAQVEAAVLLASYSRTAEAQALVVSGWCAEIVADVKTRRESWPRVSVVGPSESDGVPVRLPSAVFKAMRAVQGPILVQVPRRGYRASLSCQSCRMVARCDSCSGPLVQNQAAKAPSCAWCSKPEKSWRCLECGGRSLRAPVVGHVRTAEEFAQAFADRQVVTSGAAEVLDQVKPGNVIVLATPGAEPLVDGGYELVVLLDTWLALSRDDLRVVEESHRRWFNALAMARSGAPAVIVGESAQLQALVRSDPDSVAAAELESRAQTHLPPAGRLALVDGAPGDINALAAATWTTHSEVLGPIVVDDTTLRLIVRAPRSEGVLLARQLKELSSQRSAAKLDALRIHLDPYRI